MAAHKRAFDGACHPDIGEISSPISLHHINLDTDSDVWDNIHSLQLTEYQVTTSREILRVGIVDGSRPFGPGYVRTLSMGFDTTLL